MRSEYLSQMFSFEKKFGRCDVTLRNHLSSFQHQQQHQQHQQHQHEGDQLIINTIVKVQVNRKHPCPQPPVLPIGENLNKQNAAAAEITSMRKFHHLQFMENCRPGIIIIPFVPFVE